MDLLTVPLSPTQLKTLWRLKMPSSAGHIQVLDYDEIIKMNNINQVLKDDDRVIIYYPNYQSSQGLYGHYCCLTRKGDTLYFFDSYGGKPDIEQKKYAGDQRKELYQEEENTLIRLFLNSDYKVDYSDYKLQSDKGNISTCGRWCLLRCAMSHLTNDEFYQEIKRLCKKNKISPDLLTVKFFS